jgi:hypothetical protein
MILVYTPGGFEQSFLDREVMLKAGKDQTKSVAIWTDARPVTQLMAASKWQRSSR